MASYAVPAEPSHRAAWRLIGFLALIEFGSGFVQGVMAPLTPAVGARLGASVSQLNLISVVFFVAAAAIVPIVSAFGDIFGSRRMLRFSLVAIGLGTLLLAVAPNFPLFLVGRFLQGPIGDLIPLEIAIARGLLPRGMVGRGIGLLITGLSLGGSVGIVSAGGLSGAIHNPQRILLLCAAVVVVMLLTSLFLIPSTPARTTQRPDILGAALLAVVLGTLVFGVSQGRAHGWSSPEIVSSLVVFVVSGAVWAWYELREDNPLIDLRFVLSRDMAFLYLASLGLGVGLFGAQIAAATFLATPASVGYGLGASGMRLSLLLLPFVLFQSVGSVLAIPAARRIGWPSTAIVGLVVGAAGYVLLLPLHARAWEMVVTSGLCGAGVGVAATALPTLIAGAASRERASSAAGFYQAMRNIGGVFATVIFTGIFAQLTFAGTTVPRLGSYLLVWGICGACMVASAVVVLVTRWSLIWRDVHSSVGSSDNLEAQTS
jgi:MFS family permease